MIVRGRIVADGTGASIKAMVADRTVRFTLQRDVPEALAVIEAMKEVRSIEVVGEHVSVATADSDTVVRALVANGLPVRDLEIVAASLEDAFVALTVPDQAPGALNTAGAAPRPDGRGASR